jgi:hypothetical protein
MEFDNLINRINSQCSDLFTLSYLEDDDDILRVCTNFSLPDGGLIEIYIKKSQVKPDYFALTDLGETLGWLFCQGLDDDVIDFVSSNQIVVDEILRFYNAKLRNGMIIIYVEKDWNFPMYIINLCQAIIRITRFAYDKRFIENVPISTNPSITSISDPSS